MKVLRRSEAGFTLIELLIVVAIIAILAAIAVPNFLEAQTRAKVSRVMSDLRSLDTAISSYYVDSNSFPLYGRVTAGGAIQEPAAGMAIDDLNEYAYSSLTTPVAYVTTLFQDPFAAGRGEPRPHLQYYNYINLKVHVAMFGPTPPEFAKKLIPTWGQWRMSACGPDGDAGVDIKNNIIYDASNGTVSNGDVVRCQLRAESVPAPI